MQRHKVVFALITLLIVLLVTEGVARIAYQHIAGEPYDGDTIAKEQQALAREHTGRLVPYWQLHPYIGLTNTPNMPPSESDNLRVKNGRNSNEYGFFSPSEHFLDRAPDSFNVIITGGSVALYASQAASDMLATRLGAIPALHGLRINIVTLAVSRYKQPQQLLSVINYQMMGGRIDMIVNLDGYNDLAESEANFNSGNIPYFPSTWKSFITVTPSADLVEAAARRKSVARWQGINTRVFMRLPKDWATAGTLWMLLNATFEREKYDIQEKLDAAKSKSVIPVPPAMKNGRSEVLRIWKTASEDMQALAAKNNAVYFHFLQPNQFLQGSKQFTKHETMLMDQGFNTGPYAVLARNGYPSLQQGIRALHEGGENAYDLTGIFKDIPETIYIDSCCHVNERGSQLIVKTMADAIVTYYQSHSLPVREP